jgi:uncharacterized membrane protein
MSYLSLLVAQLPKTPVVDSMYWIMLSSRILHILGAVVLVGGLFYIRYVLTPPDVTAAPPADQLFGGRRATWAKWVGIATGLLLITGLWNYVQIAKTNDMAKQYHMIAGIKMLLALVVFALAALLAGRTTAADSLRQKWKLWLNTCLIIGIITVILGSVLRSYPHNRKLDAGDQPKLIAPANTSATS